MAEVDHHGKAHPCQVSRDEGNSCFGIQECLGSVRAREEGTTDLGWPVLGLGPHLRGGQGLNQSFGSIWALAKKDASPTS